MTSASKNREDVVAFRARWVFPVDRPPIEGGIVTIASGRIVAVGENASSRPVRDLGDVALLPTLVNAHTHLDFSDLTAPLGWPRISFPAWLELIVKHRRAVAVSVSDPNLQTMRWREAVAKGLAESQSEGIGVLGDIASPQSVHSTGTGHLEITVFLELLGLSADRQEALLWAARQHVSGQKTPHLTRGLSPHAPYTVSPQLLNQVCRLSRQTESPVAMHLAESREELKLLNSHTGPLVELLQSLGAWHPDVLPRGLRPLDYLRTLASAHHALVIHGNYLVRDEFEFLAAHRDRMSLVYCPRTHAYFGHEPYPLAELLAAGVRVAVGTDSRASNPDLRLFEELRHIACHHPGIQPAAILHMGTLAGAEALGLADQFGSITPGKRAALAVVPLSSERGDGYESLFSGAEASPLAVDAIASAPA